ncbi:ATP-dependent DNA helicase DDX11 [Anthonomus grandis grandis]|uniref:ATP-dependent DNA helicase DDX11 n=1 Tax=Anthonomus grandis grandis TaxID=2921223 RepID=UPI0021658294|nr:ATP-dependent DNA helicase DDX11 [Anthonomus grandis grandis]
MDSNLSTLPVPEEFPFPFKSYEIQLEFMKCLYSVLEEKKLGIFESPTGTGKSLSIICGALKWLKDHDEHERQHLNDQITTLEEKKELLAIDETDWFSSQSKEIEITGKLNKLKLEQRKIDNYDKKIENIRTEGCKPKQFNYKKTHSNSLLPQKGTKITNSEKEIEAISEIEDEDILLNEQTSQEPEEEDDDEEDETNDKFYPTQIIIASRTHSQLSQFVGEIRKSPFAENVRVVSLASRQNYCINSDVKALSNMTLINERCLDLQKKQSSQSKRDENGKTLKKSKTSNCQCPYFKQTNIEDLRDFALNQVHDIEDLVQVGKELSACPYYASRKGAEDAEVILVPYNTLLHKSTREASGIRLKNNIVIIDEAHNLLEALAQMHGAELNYSQLFYSLHCLKCYKQRYSTMFSATTLRFLNQLIFVVSKLISMFDKDLKDETTEIFTLENFVLSAGIEQYNFFHLIKFCKSSKIAQKVRSYALKYPLTEETIKKGSSSKRSGLKDFLSSIENKKASSGEKPTEMSKLSIPNNPLMAVVSFFESLTYSYEDGRILVTKNPDKKGCKMQFLLLNPTGNFEDIVKDARSVIVAGGTMKPNTEFRDRLFIGAGAKPANIVEFSCDHIIPEENILPISVTKGPKQEKLLFNFSNRMSMGPVLMDIIKRTCDLVKGGIVVFFPSYNYENWVFEQIKSVNLGRILFREPQKSGSVDEVLEKYSATIKKSRTGAILFSVVGGKLSEGLNFSDDLGRCVIVVGLPYANIMAVDLKEKMTFLDKKEGQGAGQQFYENLCMKAVNQCIGRAVRHKNDYATVLLLDERYGKPGTSNALPGWIKRSLKIRDCQGAFELINEFFKNK